MVPLLITCTWARMPPYMYPAKAFSYRQATISTIHTTHRHNNHVHPITTTTPHHHHHHHHQRVQQLFPLPSRRRSNIIPLGTSKGSSFCYLEHSKHRHSQSHPHPIPSRSCSLFPIPCSLIPVPCSHSLPLPLPLSRSHFFSIHHASLEPIGDCECLFGRSGYCRRRRRHHWTWSCRLCQSRIIWTIGVASLRQPSPCQKCSELTPCPCQCC